MRSGSTLLRYILDSHEGLACPPETKFLGGIEAFLDYPQSAHALLTLGIDARTLHRWTGSFVDSILRAYAAKHNKRRWIDKTPNYYRLAPMIEQLFGREVLYVMIVRHPLDCIASLESYIPLSLTHEDPDVARIAKDHGKGRFAWANYWCEVYRHLEFGAREHRDRTLLVRYEDLVRNPETIIRGVLGFLGEDYPDGLIERSFAAKHDEGYQDTKILRTSTIHDRSVGRSETWTEDERNAVWSVVGEIAVAYGYTSAHSAIG